MSKISKTKIINIVKKHISYQKKFDESMINEDLTKFGLNSINFVDMIVAIEKTFNCEVPDSKLIITEMNSINKIYDVLSSIRK